MVPNYPKEINDLLKDGLTKIKKLNLKFMDPVEIELQTKSLFLEAFGRLFLDYEKYIFMDIDTEAEEFHIDAFIKDKPNVEEKFYSQLSETQMYESFIQKIIKNKNNKTEGEIVFNEKINDIKKETISDGYSKLLDYYCPDKTYLLKPYFIEEQFTSSEEDIETEMKSKYPCDKINFVTHRLVGSMLDLDKLNDELFKKESKTKEERKKKTTFKPIIPKESPSIKESSEYSKNPSIHSKAKTEFKRVSTLGSRDKSGSFYQKYVENHSLEESINVLLSKDKMEKNFGELYTVLTTPELIHEFINILYEKEKTEGSLKVYTMENYNSLFQSIYTILLKYITEEMNDEKMTEIAKLIIITTAIIKTDNKNMFDSKNYILSNFHFMVEQNFWEKWTSLKLEEYKDKNKETSQEKLDEEKRKIIIGIMKIMKKMEQFKNEIIYQIVNGLALSLNEKEYTIFEKEVKILNG
ncbi:MAG: hypothetical protein MJ252_18620 [archaeon]|nr:hypothetical protein [archaeon]